MADTKITVALTTYNRPEYLKLAIEAILSQSFRKFEFLILDNGSDSETFELIKTYTDKRIKYVRNNVNSREFINTIWNLADGEYLLITHDDDIMKEDMLEKEIAILNNFHDVIAVSCNSTLIDSDGNIIKEKSFSLNSPIKINQFEYCQYYINKGIYLTFPSSLIRKSFFIKNNLKFELNVGPGADTYLWMKANLLPSSFYIIDVPLYFYRIHDKQDSIVNNISLNLSLFEAIFNLFIEAGYLKNLNRITYILLREYVKNYYYKLITKEIFNKKIDAIMIKLKTLKHQNKLLILSMIFKDLTLPFMVYYRILLRQRSLKRNL
jgi:glycosyltransferase involved in cell wall biosynthesis